MNSVNRKLSHRLTLVLSRTALHPNHVTTLALLTGIASGFMMAGGSRASMLAGAFFLHISFILDNCDGELARLQSRISKAGARYDLFSDFLVDCSLWLGLGFGCYQADGSDKWFWVASAACIGSGINELMVVWERRKGCCTSIHSGNDEHRKNRNSAFHSALDFISHNGDAVLPVWIFAFIGSPAVFLYSGTVYMYALIISRMISNRRQLFS